MVSIFALIKSIDMQVPEPMEVDPEERTFYHYLMSLLHKDHKIVNPTPSLQAFVQEFLLGNEDYLKNQQEAETVFESKYITYP